MMRKKRLFVLLALACRAAFCQDPNAEYWGAKATPAEIRISCSINESARTATVVIANRIAKKCYFARSGPIVGYEVIINGPSGQRLPKAEPAWPTQASAKLKPRSYSIALIALGPNERYSATLNIAQLVSLPREGGRFDVRIGQSLFGRENGTLEPDPTKTVWCKPVTVTFPPLK